MLGVRGLSPRVLGTGERCYEAGRGRCGAIVTISFSERQRAKQAARDRAASATASARRTIETERAGLGALAAALDGELADAFARAVDLIHGATRQEPATGAQGRIIVSGVGKSGHIGRK